MNTRTDHRDLGLEPGPDPRLRDDIRLLGRLLGDNVREQEGDEIYELVETIRQTSVRFHRDGEEAARHELETILAKLTPVQSFQIVRAYSYFSHLSNIAEDQQLIRNLRQQAMAGLSPQPGTLARAFERAREAGLGPVELRRFRRIRLYEPGPHGTSHRSAPQEHDDPRIGDCGSARQA